MRINIFESYFKEKRKKINKIPKKEEVMNAERKKNEYI